MERQQVRDAKKQAEHTKQLRKIRETKESERLRIEQAEAEKMGQYDDSSSEVRDLSRMLIVIQSIGHIT